MSEADEMLADLVKQNEAWRAAQNNFVVQSALLVSSVRIAMAMGQITNDLREQAAKTDAAWVAYVNGGR